MYTERVLHLEADLRRSEITIQGLQQELAATKLAQTPTTDTQRTSLATTTTTTTGTAPRGQGSPPRPALSGQVAARSVEEVASIVTETSVAKGVYVYAVLYNIIMFLTSRAHC